MPAKRAAKSLTAYLCCQSIGSQFARDEEVLVGEGFLTLMFPLSRDQSEMSKLALNFLG